MNRGYTKIPNELLDTFDLSIQARYLLCVLLRHNAGSGKCFPTQGKLGTELGRSPKQIRVILSELIKAKALTKRRRGYNRSNDYFISKKYVVKNLPATTAKYYGEQTKTYVEKRYKSSVHKNADDLLNSKQEIVKDNIYFDKQKDFSDKMHGFFDDLKRSERNSSFDSFSDKESKDKVYVQKTRKPESTREIIESREKSAESTDSSTHQLMIDGDHKVKCGENPTPTKTQQSQVETLDFSNIDSHEGVQE